MLEFNADQLPRTTVTVAVRSIAATPAAFLTVSVYVVVCRAVGPRSIIEGATLVAEPEIGLSYVDPSSATIVAVPNTTGDVPKSNVGVSVVEKPS